MEVQFPQINPVFCNINESDIDNKPFKCYDDE